MFQMQQILTVVVVTILPCLVLTTPASAQPVEPPAVEWEQTFGLGSSTAWSVQQTNDGGYIVAGSSPSVNPPSFNAAYLAKTNALGQLLWERTYATSSSASRSYSAQQTTDGGYVATGFSSDIRGMLVYLLKTDEHGDPEWERTFGDRLTISRGTCSH